ncbi:MAG: hypothetical protein EOP83_34725, partial [Verrucomicrobiaceae bacterium]
MSLNATLRSAVALAALAAATAAAAHAQTPTIVQTAPATPQTSQDQLNQLTPEQQAQVKAIVAQMIAEQQASQPELLPSPPPPTPTVATSWSGGSPRTTEEDRIFKINGRVMYDAFNVSTD